MPAFWVDAADVQGDQLVLRGEEAHHAAHVRRCRAGDLVEAVDGAGEWYQARVERLGAGEVVCRVCARHAGRGESAVRLSLGVALVGGARFDWLVEKATEVGVETVVPLLTERGVVRPGSQARPQRWERLARAAVKQCGRSRQPAILPAQPLARAVEWMRGEGHQVLLAAPAAGGLAAAVGGAGAPRWGLLVGPEGGFSPAEEELAVRAGGRCFAWGERLLRVETAGVVLAALVIEAVQRQQAAARRAR